ncbi:PD-(D/E)XK nuclease family protein [Francisella philomiragia]|uniref:PD-(D/E)XK nuclease family protein n=1 Tax=Francisella philomiragia TaxID=28110 RepID=A0ABS1G9N0_9GAMM|nr:PD-(D/E)XK nuclease family protein [Francisella philomiragia]MBK2257665.1 PD-(D/E)XK nuclease family protein [Francisella philomiragia]MBK2301353.1 PD-(D/E)XK nuclease family protein [Francisella philomiragia]
MEKTEYDWLCELKKSPIFNMSLSSKELFHSNFIAWMLETYPKQMANFFSGEPKSNESNLKIENIQREKQNIDISFKLGDTLVLIENKVKSIANLEQLEKYNQLVVKNYKDSKVKKILLSLKNPTIDLNSTKGWIYLSYDDLLDAFNKLKAKNEYHKSLITDYVSFVRSIKVNIIDEINIDEVQISNLYDKKEESYKYLESLKEIKMHDIFLKGLYEDFADKIYNEILSVKDLGVKVKYATRLSEDANIFVSHDFTDGKGLVDIKYKIDKYFFIGIQIQGDEYRHFAVLYNDKIRHVESILGELKDIWFEFKEIGERATYPVRKGLEYRSYTTKNYIFKHKSFKIDDMKNTEVIKRVKKDIQKIVDNKQEIEKIYNHVGK